MMEELIKYVRENTSAVQVRNAVRRMYESREPLSVADYRLYDELNDLLEDYAFGDDDLQDLVTGIDLDDFVLAL